MRAKPVPHRRMGVLVTADGRCLREGTRAFLDALGEYAPDWDAGRFAVVNLGFVALLRDGGRFDILVHPRTAGPVAIDGAIALVGTSGAALFTIAWLAASGWRRESFPSARDACIRLMELCRIEQVQDLGTAASTNLDGVAPVLCRS